MRFKTWLIYLWNFNTTAAKLYEELVTQHCKFFVRRQALDGQTNGHTISNVPHITFVGHSSNKYYSLPWDIIPTSLLHNQGSITYTFYYNKPNPWTCRNFTTSTKNWIHVSLPELHMLAWVDTFWRCSLTMFDTFSRYIKCPCLLSPHELHFVCLFGGFMPYQQCFSYLTETVHKSMFPGLFL